MADDLTPEQLELLKRLQADPALLQHLSQVENSAVAISVTGSAKAENHYHAETIQFVLQASGVSDDESRALADYLQDLAKECQKLPLGGIDSEHTNVESLADQPELSQVYVELNVRELKSETEARERIGKTGKDEALFARGKEDPWSALEACAHHRRTVILGDPGGGKSTFLRMLAFNLASDFQNRGDNTKLESDSPFSEPLVPILVNLRDFAAADFGKARPVTRLARFIRSEREAADQPAVCPVLERLWRDGRAIVFLDGLDEIAQSERRDYVLESIRAFANRHENTRILVTCRIAAYERLEGDEAKTDWRLPPHDFPVVTLAPFTRDQQHRFIRRWYLELKTRRRITSDPELKTESLCRALERSHIARLAPNPLLLTVMTIVHADRGELPHERVKLYEEAVDTLLRRWRQGRDLGEGGDDRNSVASILTEANRNSDHLESRLWKLAWEVHGKTPEGGSEKGKDSHDDPVADIPYGDLVEHLRGLHPDNSREWTARLIEAIKHRSGLLIERKRGVFTFPHRTFQEYLAARDLVRRHEEFTQEAARLLDSKTSLWREVVLLAAGSFAHQWRNPDAVFPLIRFLLDPILPNEIPASGLVMAADLICEMTPQNVRDAEKGADLIGELTEKLLSAMNDSNRGIKVRATCGSALGRLGDPREGVSDLNVRDPAFWSEEIPPDPFPMGNDEAPYEQEKPRFQCSLIEHPYAISRHPITAGQFHRFIEAGGYREKCDSFWTEAGLAWRNENEITGPETYSEVFQTPNHPQVGVSWYEATAFCCWLAEESGLPIRLPTEPEWERAARHTDARLYPWGNEESEESVARHANIWDTRIRTTSPVGLFLEGKAVCGALDLAGNVWEWTASLSTDNYKKYPKNHDTSSTSKGARVLRGGAWLYDTELARCAYRLRNAPNNRINLLGFRVCVSPFSPSGL